MTYNQSPHIRVRSGIYHFVRRVPADLQQHYRSDRVSISLRTKSARPASRSAVSNGYDMYISFYTSQKSSGDGKGLLQIHVSTTWVGRTHTAVRRCYTCALTQIRPLNICLIHQHQRSLNACLWSASLKLLTRTNPKVMFQYFHNGKSL